MDQQQQKPSFGELLAGFVLPKNMTEVKPGTKKVELRDLISGGKSAAEGVADLVRNQQENKRLSEEARLAKSRNIERQYEDNRENIINSIAPFKMNKPELPEQTISKFANLVKEKTPYSSIMASQNRNFGRGMAFAEMLAAPQREMLNNNIATAEAEADYLNKKAMRDYQRRLDEYNNREPQLTGSDFYNMTKNLTTADMERIQPLVEVYNAAAKSGDQAALSEARRRLNEAIEHAQQNSHAFSTFKTPEGVQITGDGIVGKGTKAVTNFLYKEARKTFGFDPHDKYTNQDDWQKIANTIEGNNIGQAIIPLSSNSENVTQKMLREMKLGRKYFMVKKGGANPSYALYSQLGNSIVPERGDGE